MEDDDKPRPSLQVNCDCFRKMLYMHQFMGEEEEEQEQDLNMDEINASRLIIQQQLLNSIEFIARATINKVLDRLQASEFVLRTLLQGPGATETSIEIANQIVTRHNCREWNSSKCVIDTVYFYKRLKQARGNNTPGRRLP